MIVRSFDIVLKNLNKEVTKLQKMSTGGLIKAVNFLHNEMEHTAPIIPLDSGNLRSSFFKTVSAVGENPSITFGFSASYAVFVHEKLGEGVNWQRPSSGPKFMEHHIYVNQDKLLNIIGKELKV